VVCQFLNINTILALVQGIFQPRRKIRIDAIHSFSNEHIGKNFLGYQFLEGSRGKKRVPVVE